MPNVSIQYTPIQQRIIDLLSDGLPHERRDMLKCINPNSKNLNGLAVHIAFLRSKVRELRQDIVTELRRGGIYYRMVILLPTCNLSEDPL
jgi:hypothetical protein